MAINIYDVIEGAVLSEKAQKLNSDLNKLVLNIHKQANKPMVKEALQKLFNVKVKQIRTFIRKGKLRKVKRNSVVGKDQKRAVITLADGYSLDMFNGQESVNVQSKKVASVVEKV